MRLYILALFLIFGCAHNSEQNRIPNSINNSGENCVQTMSRLLNQLKIVAPHLDVHTEDLESLFAFDSWLSRYHVPRTRSFSIELSREQKYPTYFYYDQKALIPFSLYDRIDTVAAFHEISHNSFKNNLFITYEGRRTRFQDLYDQHLAELEDGGPVEFLDNYHRDLQKQAIAFEELYADFLPSLFLRDPKSATRSIGISREFSVSGANFGFFSSNGARLVYYDYPNHSYPRSFQDPISFRYPGNGIFRSQVDIYSVLDPSRKAIWAYLFKESQKKDFSPEHIISAFLKAVSETVDYNMKNGIDIMDTANTNDINKRFFRSFVKELATLTN